MKIVPSIRKLLTKRRLRSRTAAVLSWAYLLLLLVLIPILRLGGDRNWRVTLLLFSPRWVALLPLLILVPVSFWLERRMLIVLGLASVIAVFPLMGFCVGWHRFTTTGRVDALPLRIVAFNIHHVELTDPAARQFLMDAHPDVVALEEADMKSTQALFPRGIWQVSVVGELLVASRNPILEVRPLPDNFATVYRLKTPAGPIDLVIVHLSSPHYGLRDAVRGEGGGRAELSLNIKERTEQSALLSRLSSQAIDPMIIAGDFNLLFDSPLLRNQFPGMTDCFEATGLGFGWTYKNRWTAVRIDRVLSSKSFDPRAFALGPSLGSPHRPVIADFLLK